MDGGLDEAKGGFGRAVTAAGDEAAGAWRAAWRQLLSFTGDPIATLDAVNATDPRFVLGPVFTLAYRLLGGAPPDAADVVADAVRVADRCRDGDEREQAHAAAALALHAGEFDDAARRWSAVGERWPDDLAAHRLAHDVCLHIGDDTERVPAAEEALAAFAAGTPAWGYAAGMAAFAYEEVGRYDEAERLGAAALAVDGGDLWARHALAHVYESTARHEALLDLLVPTSVRWGVQALLANHVWWHVALRLLEHGEPGAALVVVDERLVSRTAFGLADATSMLWRLQLAGGAVDGDLGGRWDELLHGWSTARERHTCGFLDLHAALAFAARPDHPAAARFAATLAGRHAGTCTAGGGTGGGATAVTFNDVTFRDTVVPLAAGLAQLRTDPAAAAGALDAVGPTLHRVGGSVVQRDIVARTARWAREQVPA